MSKPEFQVRLAGVGVAPETVDVADLLDLLGGFRKAVCLVARDDEGFADADEPLLSLVGVMPGSAGFRLTASKAALSAVVALAEAIHTGDFAGIQHDALAALADISRRVVRKHWEFSIHPGPGTHIQPAMISEGNEVPSPPPVTMTGDTRVYGRLIRVGGARPTVMVKPFNADRSVTITVSEEQAKELAIRLYDVIGVECTVGWAHGEDTPVSLKAVKILPYKRLDILEAFQELATAAGAKWDDVDGSAYVKGLRTENKK